MYVPLGLVSELSAATSSARNLCISYLGDIVFKVKKLMLAVAVNWCGEVESNHPAVFRLDFLGDRHLLVGGVSALPAKAPQNRESIQTRLECSFHMNLLQVTKVVDKPVNAGLEGKQTRPNIFNSDTQSRCCRTLKHEM